MKISAFTRPNIGREIPIHFLQQSEVLKHLKSFFRVSKVVGGLPIITFRENGPVSRGFFNTSNLWSLLLVVNYVLLLGFTVGKGENFIRVSGPEIFMKIGLIANHVWALIYSARLVRTMRETVLVEKRLRIYTEVGDVGKLRREVVGVISVYLAFGIGITIISGLSDILISGSTLDEAWAQYSKTSCSLEPNALLHSTLTNFYCFASTFLANFGWIFPDFLLILLSLIFSNFYRRLIRGIKGIEPGRFSIFEIDLIREHFGILSKLVIEYDDSISGLNLISFVFNIAVLLTSGYASIIANPRRNPPYVKFGITMAIVIFKLFSGMITASYLHLKAQEASVHIRSWPMTRDDQQYSMAHTKVWIIHSFLVQLSLQPKTGFTLGKMAEIKFKVFIWMILFLCSFFTFTRIVTTACVRRR